jgi:hypothetical protein
MDRQRSSGDAFSRGANRDAHDAVQVGDETRARIAANRRGGELEKAAMAKELARRHDRDIVDTTHDIYREYEHQRAQRPWWHLRSEKPSPEKVAELALQRVQERNRAALAAIDRMTAQREKEILEAARLRSGKVEKDRAAIEALREQKQRDREATRGRGR